MRIVIDLDGVICQLKGTNENYADMEPVEGAIEGLRRFKKAGHIIILNTARNMGTYEGNEGKALKNIGKSTFDWLDKHEVPFDEIYFGKPSGDLYIDDKGLRFNNWEQILDEI